MSVKHSLLTLIALEPRTASQLRKDMDEHMGGLFSLNIGQVSQTLSRLERDGLISSDTTTSESGRDVAQYRITEKGRQEADAWWDTPIHQPGPSRDELVIKFALAAQGDSQDLLPDFLDLVDAQRLSTIRQIRELNAQASDLPDERTAPRMNIERQIFELEGIARWLDRIEAFSNPSTDQPRKARHD